MDEFKALTNSSRSRRAPIVPIRAVARPVMPQTAAATAPAVAVAARPPVSKVEEKRAEPQTKTAPEVVKVPVHVEVVVEAEVEAVGEATPTAESPISTRADEADEPTKETGVNVSTCETTSNNDDDKASESTTSCSAKADELVLPKESPVTEVAAPKPAAAAAVGKVAAPQAAVASPPVSGAPKPTAVRPEEPRFCKNCPGPKVPHRCYKSSALSLMDQMKALQIKPRRGTRT